MGRADFNIDLLGGDVDAGADVGFTGEELGGGFYGSASVDPSDVPFLGEFGNRAFVVWALAAGVVFLAWRAVKGF